MALLCVVFSRLFVTFPCDVPGQVWYLIVSLSDLCLPLYFSYSKICNQTSRYKPIYQTVFFLQLNICMGTDNPLSDKKYIDVSL